MTNLFDDPEDATLLEAEEKEELKQSWITTRADLNEAEQANIAKAVSWAAKGKARQLLTDGFVRELHKRMFSDVWAWAGKYRKTARNLGIDAYRIPTEIASLLSDVRYWVENKSFPSDEIAVRFHHRLVAIHPFPNGNGRHSRLMADLLIHSLGRPEFSWGRANLRSTSEMRASYIRALKEADENNLGPLTEFARS